MATDEKELTIERSIADFKRAYRAKSKLIERQKEDFLFRLGKQWTDEDVRALSDRKIKAVTDNRIQPNIFLLTGLERQNRSDFKAFPQGEEDSIKAEIASYLFKDSIKVSDFGYKASEAFEDGVTCGESHLELYLDNTFNLLNGKPCVKKDDANQIFPEPGHKEYDFSDARYVYKLTVGLSKEDLCSLFPDKEDLIYSVGDGRLDVKSLLNGDETHNQPKDYKKEGGDSADAAAEDASLDLLERYYKKWVPTVFVGDHQTGEIKQAESEDKANEFLNAYQQGIALEQDQHMQAVAAHQMGVMSGQINPTVQPAPLPPTPKDPNRFKMFTRRIPEIWYYAHTPGMTEPLADERAWFYPKWKAWPFIPVLAHFSTAPVDGDDAHLRVQGIVHGVKGVQEKHNKAETLKVLHLQSSTNSGWLAEEDSWVDSNKVEQFGSQPGINLEYKKGRPMPQRIQPVPLSQAHTQIGAESAEAIKAILGINADLLAVQQGGTDSGRAIALRQRQGLLMVQKLFDNFSRSKQLFGRFLLSQLGEMYDTETAKKILGEAWLSKNFPPPMQTVPQMDPATGAPVPVQIPMADPATGQPMTYDKEAADAAIAEVLSGELDQYDVTVGEAVASETMKLANAAELKELASQLGGLIPPDLLVEESQLNQATKNRVLSAIKQSQAMPMLPAPAHRPALQQEPPLAA